jgi:hypothetical protein
MNTESGQVAADDSDPQRKNSTWISCFRERKHQVGQTKAPRWTACHTIQIPHAEKKCTDRTDPTRHPPRFEKLTCQAGNVELLMEFMDYPNVPRHRKREVDVLEP